VISAALAPGFAGFTHRDARLALAASLAFFIGYVSQAGLPGSVVAIAIAVLAASLAGWQFKRGWTRTTLAAAVINLVALIAVAIEPGPLNLAIAWFSLAGFALVQNGVVPANILALGKTIILTLIVTPWNFVSEIKLIRAMRNRSRTHPRLMTLANILLPLLAISIFGGLLMTANPLIELAVLQVSWESIFGILMTWMPLVSVTAFLLVRAVLEIRPFATANSFEGTGTWQPQFFMPVPVIITLLALNGMFLAENILDLQYVWSGTVLPAGMNYAEYVHRGSYTLIATAILAGALVILALQPGSRSESSPPVRWLVYLWTMQNVLLVASSAKRTLAYVDAYGMTLWRLSGLIWMGLVAAGLIFIVARVITKRSNLWLLNTNLSAAFALLLVCGLIDFKGVVAEWNVSRAISKITTPNSDFDAQYMQEMGSSAILALNRFISLTPPGGIMSWTAFHAKGLAQGQLAKNQGEWKTWTLRGAWIEAGNTP
jgi:hypothetical protein